MERYEQPRSESAEINVVEAISNRELGTRLGALIFGEAVG